MRPREEADILEVEKKMQAVVVKLQYHITREQSGLQFEKLAEEKRKKLAGAKFLQFSYIDSFPSETKSLECDKSVKTNPVNPMSSDSHWNVCATETLPFGTAELTILVNFLYLSVEAQRSGGALSSIG